jgi:nucleoside-diphosphate-sugar epimerase
MSKFIVVGAGPVGRAVTRELVSGGHEVGVITRSGSSVPKATPHALDATNSPGVAALATGALAIINCANPPYTSWDTDWPPIAASLLQAAEQSCAALITMSNLYAYGPTHQQMHATTPLDSKGKKGMVRAKMWTDGLAAHGQGRVKVAEVRASDFFGPEVRDANLGERVMPKILLGKRVQVLGRTDVPHSFSFMPDVGRTLARVASDPSAWGRAWLVPSITMTQQKMIAAIAAEAHQKTPKISTLPSAVMSVLAAFVPLMRELKEIQYQFTAPFVVDASDTTAILGIVATSTNDALRQTVDWWRAHS